MSGEGSTQQPDRAARRRGALYTLVAAQAAAVYLLAFHGARAAPRGSFVAAMFAIAAVANVGWVLRRYRPAALFRLSRVEWLATAAFALFSVAANLCVAQAMETLGSGPMAALNQTGIFFVALLGWVFLHERIDRALAIGVVLAALGVLVGRAPGVSVAAWNPAGVSWGLVAVVFLALMLVVGRAAARAIDVERVNAARLVIAAPLLCALPGAAGGLADLSAREWGWAALAALTGPVVSRLLQLFALRDLSAAGVKLGMLTTVVWAFVLEGVLFGTVPTAAGIVGASLIVAGVAVPAAKAARG